MSELRKAAQQALIALEFFDSYVEPLTQKFGGPKVPARASTAWYVHRSIAELRAALAEPAELAKSPEQASLKRDAAAFRLMVDRQLRVLFSESWVQADSRKGACRKPIGLDPYAAARRAITDAAKAIEP